MRHFSCREFEQIVNVPKGRLRYWSRLGLVPSKRREQGQIYYDFRSLLRVRKIQNLVEKGISAARIRRVLNNPAGVAATELEDTQLSTQRKRILLGQGEHIVDCESGQLVFDFEKKPGRLYKMPQIARPSAEEWFRKGLSYDLWDDSHNAAIHAYQEAIRLDPNFADAYVNLGTIHCNGGNLGIAEELYRRALSIDPDHSKANFNLANVLDEKQQTSQAVFFYKKALETEPDFADALYNLATAYERLGRWEGAINYWKRYLELDSLGSNQSFVQGRLKLIRARKEIGD